VQVLEAVACYGRDDESQQAYCIWLLAKGQDSREHTADKACQEVEVHDVHFGERSHNFVDVVAVVAADVASHHVH